LPQLETWIATNKDRLAASFQVAADFAVKLLTVAIAFGDWVSNNTGKVQILAAIIAGMFVINTGAKFILMIEGIIAAMALLRTTALGAAIATALATGGVSVGTAVTALAAVGATGLVTKNLFDMINGKSGVQSGKGISPRGNSGNRDFISNPFSTVGGTDAYNAFLKSLNNNTKAVKANTKNAQDAITAEAVRQNLARQKSLSGSTALAVGQGGKLYMPKSGVNVVVNNAGSVITQENLVTSIVNGIERTTRRSFGTVGAFDIL
jgi:hypothetical protein